MPVLSSWKRLLCVLLIVAISGCGKSPKPDAEGVNSAETGGKDPEANSTGKKIIPIRRDVKALDGNWVMVVTLQGRDRYIWLVGMNKDAEGKFQGEILDVAKNDTMEPKVESLEIDGKSVHLRVKNTMAVLDFQGDFDGVAVRGTLSSGPQEIYIARLLPADASKLTDYVGDALPPGADVFMKTIQAMQNQPNPKVILQMAHEHRTSPMSLETTFGLLSLHARAGFDDPTVMAIIDEYIDLSKVWGKRMQSQAEVLCAQQLVTSARLPAEALKHLDEGEKLLGDNAEFMKPRIQLLREQAQIQLSLVKSHSASKEERDAAHVELQDALKKQPYNAEILMALADYCADNMQPDAAIDYYSTVVALPLLEQFILARRAGQPPGPPTPTEALTKLWTERHPSDDLQAHLVKRYDEKIDSMRKELREKGPPPQSDDVSNHVVLVEFFTGGQMPPAVATEVAVDTLSETYPTSKIVALRFHQHIPGPDGLVNQDSEDRFAYYEQGKTPLLVLDGAVLDSEQAPYGGFVQSSGNAYAILRALVDPRLKQSTPIRIELSAVVENGELTIKAEAVGATEEQLPSLRLRMALAEESVDAPLPNGIRHHGMVVREMPGGARGIAPRKGELKFSYSMPLSDVQQHLDSYLTRYESGNKIEIPPAMKPGIKTPLYLVAWVQDDKANSQRPDIGRAVLQTAIVPIKDPSQAKPTEQPKTTPDPKPAVESPPPPALPME